ncbi:DinB family protein [Galbitalea soli]|uniref:DinB-like domain-containing protein n=1 Tax=Galbitalea soli TaxID=1268042 RepID=A0A7C9PNN9_9MICO|nr:DinB family protein [Galbitalea soli]NEM91626.1 hypothetical protein [Galbitalea soli]NYJ30320.1 hypothetical protein [Galbitalea soli]
MDLTQWLVAELDDTSARLDGQILSIVPSERQGERMPGGNSITWATYHLARHASLALQVTGFYPLEADPRLAEFDPAATVPGSGLQEVEQPWAAALDAAEVAAFAGSVITDVREYLATLDGAALDDRPDVAAALRAAGIDETSFGWLYRMWDAPLGFLVRWPLLGHITNHVGEMIGTRNQMGLSPFR